MGKMKSLEPVHNLKLYRDLLCKCDLFFGIADIQLKPGIKTLSKRDVHMLLISNDRAI